jgi:PKD repeat protein
LALTVTDNAGATGSASQSVAVANAAPTAAFSYSPLSPSTEDKIRFSNASTDPDGTIVAWAWDFGDGATSSAPNPRHRYADHGVYTVALTVTDDDGATSTTSQPVSVANLPPTAAFIYAPGKPTTQDVVRFGDASTDADGQIVSWLWDFGDGATSADQDPTHQYADGGSYPVSLTVTDDDGASSTASRSITVRPAAAQSRVQILWFQVPSSARAGSLHLLLVAVGNTGPVLTNVRVQVKRVQPTPEGNLGSRTVRLAPGQRALLLFVYLFKAKDVPTATFRATATPVTPAGQGDTAEASTEVDLGRRHSWF